MAAWWWLVGCRAGLPQELFWHWLLINYFRDYFRAELKLDVSAAWLLQNQGFERFLHLRADRK